MRKTENKMNRYYSLAGMSVVMAGRAINVYHVIFVTSEVLTAVILA